MIPAGGKVEMIMTTMEQRIIVMRVHRIDCRGSREILLDAISVSSALPTIR